jgi:hypothetical protein
VERRRAVVTDMRERGVRFVAGSDAGVVRTPHRSYAEGLVAMAAYGFGAGEVLRAATGWAADAIGLTGEAGVLVPGRVADLVVVDGDPLADLRVLAHPSLVLRAGRAASGSDGPGGAPVADGPRAVFGMILREPPSAPAQSAQWAKFGPDVLPAWLAEMDFPVADIVRDAVRDAVDRELFGYAPAPLEADSLPPCSTPASTSATFRSLPPR